MRPKWTISASSSSQSLPRERNPASGGWIADKRVCEAVRQSSSILYIFPSYLLSSDAITVIELPNKIRKEFVDAPSQFKAISDEYTALTTFREMLTH
jgi:hypothetical protein